VAYRELTGIHPHVACAWARDGAPPGRVLPDACVDVVWTGGRLLVAGPATGPVLTDGTAGAIGVRFRVGAAGAALGLPASELLDQMVPLEAVWGRDAVAIADRVATADDPLEALAAAVIAHLDADGPDRAVRAALAGAPPSLGERHLRRRFHNAVGYGPKTLERVLRFQRFLGLARLEAEPDLARLALDAGYADQAHLTRECRRLAGVTPAALLATGAGPAGDPTLPGPARSSPGAGSVSFNTRGAGGGNLAA
jgi:AraC-like DNA-binding protein